MKIKNGLYKYINTNTMQTINNNICGYLLKNKRCYNATRDHKELKINLSTLFQQRSLGKYNFTVKVHVESELRQNVVWSDKKELHSEK